MAASMAFSANLKPYPCPPPLFMPSPKPSLFISNFPLTKPTSSSSSLSSKSTSSPSARTHQLPPEFTQKQLLETLRKENDPEMALCVFDLASKQPNFVPTLSVYEEMLRKLGKVGSFDSMKRVLEEMKQSGCAIDEGIFFIFIDSYVGFGGLYEEAVAFVDDMEQDFGLKCGSHIYNYLLNVLVDANKLKLVEIVHNKMVESGVKPGVSTYNILIKGLCKAHQIRPALLMMEEMERSGLNPDETTYTTIMYGYIEEENMDAALRVREQMMEAGCSATIVTVNVLVYGFCKEGSLEEALSFLQEMASQEGEERENWEEGERKGAMPAFWMKLLTVLPGVQ